MILGRRLGATEETAASPLLLVNTSSRNDHEILNEISPRLREFHENSFSPQSLRKAFRELSRISRGRFTRVLMCSDQDRVLV